MRLLLIAAGLGSALIGCVVVLVGIAAIIDPAGAQLADDGNPFGAPPSRIVSAVLTLAGAALVAVPVVLWLRDEPPDRD